MPVLVLLWAFYLSLVVAGQDFLGFQWDGLLLETGLLAVFLAPAGLRPRPGAEGPVPLSALWLLRFLLFRLMFTSGAVKLRSGDPLWRGLSALRVHYQTQPLPTWIGWLAHQLPAKVHTLSAAVMFVVELVVPFLIFGPRPLRLAACGAMAGLQLLIAATGNYGFFNLLTLVLYLALVDDRVLAPLRRDVSRAEGPTNGAAVWHLVASGLAMLIACFSLMALFREVDLTRGEPSVVSRLWSSRALNAVAPLDSINGYGLFRVMTTERPEIVVEVSADGAAWKEWEFKWKAGDVTRRPSFVEPHMPRLDWQMWFAALDPAGAQYWLESLMRRIRDGEPAVIRLLGPIPIAGRPLEVRLAYYDYRFTTPAERARSGAWWIRTLKGYLN